MTDRLIAKEQVYIYSHTLCYPVARLIDIVCLRRRRRLMLWGIGYFDFRRFLFAILSAFVLFSFA